MEGPRAKAWCFTSIPAVQGAWRENAKIMTLVNAFRGGNQQVFVVCGIAAPC